jgi:hypothetical protein
MCLIASTLCFEFARPRNLHCEDPWAANRNDLLGLFMYIFSDVRDLR